MMDLSPWELYTKLSVDHQPRPVDSAILRLGLMGVASIKPDRQTGELAFKVDGFGRLRYWSKTLADLPLSFRARKLHVYYDPGNPHTVAVYDGEQYLCDVDCIDKIPFRDEGGEKVRSHLKAKAEFLGPRQAEIKALKRKGPQAETVSEPPPLLVFFDSRPASKQPETVQSQEAESPIQPHPTEKGAYINTETGEVYRGNKVVPLITQENTSADSQQEEELEAMRERQRKRNLPAYLRGQP